MVVRKPDGAPPPRAVEPVSRGPDMSLLSSVVHPIEWLRAVARSDDVPRATLVSESASALAALADEPNDLLLACRRLLDRHTQVGALWSACARMVAAADPVAEARAIQADMRSDQVGLSLAVDLPDAATVTVVGAGELAVELSERRGDVRILVVADEAHTVGAADDTVVVVPPLGLGAAVGASNVVLLDGWAVGTGSFLAAQGSQSAAVLARHAVPSSGTPDATVWLAVGVGQRLPKALFETMQGRMVGSHTEPWSAHADLVDMALVDRVVEPVAIGCPVPPELLQPHTSR